MVDSSSVISVHGLVRRYGNFTAIGGLDLEVRSAECVAILGPNGAGKTTTVEILEGYRHRDAGEVSVLGLDPASPTRAWRQRIGIVAQSAADLGDVTVREAFAHFARFYNHPRGVQETAELVGLTDKITSRVGVLSGGQRRRLDVGLGVIGRPELLFLDEPTTGFDPEARQLCWQLVERLKVEGVTIVLTTHYLEEADALADRVVVIARGLKVADATPGDLGARSQDDVTVRWREGDVPHELRTSTPTAKILELAARLGDEVEGLEVVRTSLEAAYLELLEEDTP